MSDIKDVPKIVVDDNLDDEGGSFYEETLNIGTTPSEAKIYIEGSEIIDNFNIDDPTTLGSGVSIELEITGLKVSRTIFDNRARAKAIPYTASFNADDSDEFMSLIFGTNFPFGTFTELSFDDILVKISERSREFDGASIIYNGGGDPKLLEYAGEFKFENTDLVSAFNQVLERAGNFSWWLERNSGPPNENIFTNNVQILNLGDPSVAREIGQLKVNIASASFSGADESSITGAIVTDKDGRGSKMQFGVPQDAGSSTRPGITYASADPLVGGPITSAHVPASFNFERYNLLPVDLAGSDQVVLKSPVDENGNAVVEDLELSFNTPSGAGGTSPIFSVPDAGAWPNAEPLSEGAITGTSEVSDFVKIGRKFLTHPNIDPVIEAYYSPLPTLLLGVKVFNQFTKIDPNDGTTTIVSPQQQYNAWRESAEVLGITNQIGSGQYQKYKGYQFLIENYLNSSGNDAMKVALIAFARPYWTTIPEIKVDFNSGYVYVPNKYFHLLGNWSQVAEFSFTYSSQEATGAGPTNPKILISANFLSALANSNIRFLGTLERTHKIARAGTPPYTAIRRDDFQSTNVVFNISGTPGYNRFLTQFNDYPAMEAIANSLLSQTINKSGAKGTFTIYPGDQSVTPGIKTNGGVIVKVSHKYLPYFQTTIYLANDDEYYNDQEVERRRQLSTAEQLAALTDQSIREQLGSSSASGHGGSISLVPPHTHSDQYTGGNSFGHVIVKSLTIEGQTKRDDGSFGPSFEFSAFGDHGPLDVVFDSDKGKFVSNASIFLDKAPSIERVDGGSENESTQFTDINSREDDFGERAKFGFIHNIFDFVRQGAGTTDISSRLALNIVPHLFEPFHSTYNDSADILKSWGGDRIYIGDAIDRPGFLGSYTSNPVLLYSRYSSENNGKDFAGNNTQNLNPASVLGVRKPSNQSTKFNDTLFNFDSEFSAYAGIMFPDSGKPNFKIELLDSDSKGTAPNSQFPNKSGYYIGMFPSGGFYSTDQNKESRVELTRLVNDEDRSQAGYHSYAISNSLECGYGQRISGPGTPNDIPDFLKTGGSTKFRLIELAYVSNQQGGASRKLVAVENGKIVFAALDSDYGSLDRADTLTSGAIVDINKTGTISFRLNPDSAGSLSGTAIDEISLQGGASFVFQPTGVIFENDETNAGFSLGAGGLHVEDPNGTRDTSLSPIGWYLGNVQSTNTDISYGNGFLSYSVSDMAGYVLYEESIELVTEADLNDIRRSIDALYTQIGQWSGGGSPARGSGGGITQADLDAAISALAWAALGLIDDLQAQVDDINARLDAILKKLKKIQNTLAGLGALLVFSLGITIALVLNKKKKEGKNTDPGGGITPGPIGGTTPSNPGSVDAPVGPTEPGGLTPKPTGNSGGTQVDPGGGGFEPGGGEEGEGKDNKSAATGLVAGIPAQTGNAQPSAGSVSASDYIHQRYQGDNPVYIGIPRNEPYLTPENSLYDHLANNGSIPIGLQFNPETTNPTGYLLNIPEVDLATAQTIWELGGGGGAPTGATGSTSNDLLAKAVPGADGWDKTQDIRRILQLANRTPTLELDAAGRWTFVGGGYLFPTMITSGGRIAISDDSSVRVNIGGLDGYAIGVLKELTGIDLITQQRISQRAFGLYAKDDDLNSLIINSHGIFLAELGADGLYQYSDPTQPPQYGGVIGDIYNKINHQNTLTPTTDTDLFVGGSMKQVVANSTIEEAIVAIDAATFKNKLNGSAAPTVNDDSGDGYTVGSMWIDTAADAAYVCVDSTVGAAVWNAMSGDMTHGKVMSRTYLMR